MRLFHSGRAVEIESEAYRLRLLPPPENSFFRDRRSGRLFAFAAGGDCNTPEQNDDAVRIGGWEVAEEDGNTVLLRNTVVSRCWEKRIFTIRAEEHRLEFFHELAGRGALQDVRFFRVSCGEGEFGFCGEVDEVFSPAPNFHGQNHYHTTQTVALNYGNDLSLTAGGMALASVPHVLALRDRRDRDCTVFGAFADPGCYDWDEFVWNPAAVHAPTPYVGDSVLGGGFAIRYYGRKKVEGVWRSPKLCVTFVRGEEKVLAAALEDACRHGYLPRPAPRSDGPAWWREPIFCTWHEQASLATGMKVDFNTPGETPVGTLCTRKNTERWLDILESHGCRPGTVILDDKWQRHLATAEPDETKWPEMRRWIDGCHARGIRVFLWCMSWYKEGIPADEMMTRDGVPVCGDITDPKFEARTRAMVRKMFSDAPDGLDADGVKIDGLLNLPTGPGLKNHGDLWGLELQKRFLEVFCGEAKKVKPDVCISVFTANPYLDEYTDMVRLGDMYHARLTPERSMEIRAEVIRACHPGKPIDTDGQFYFCAGPDWLTLLAKQAKIGIPTIYNAEILRHGRFFMNPEVVKWQESDYRYIAEVFDRYRLDAGLLPPG